MNVWKFRRRTTHRVPVPPSVMTDRGVPLPYQTNLVPFPNTCDSLGGDGLVRVLFRSKFRRRTTHRVPVPPSVMTDRGVPLPYQTNLVPFPNTCDSLGGYGPGLE